MNQLAYFTALQKLDAKRRREKDQITVGPVPRNVTCKFLSATGQALETVDVKEQQFSLQEDILFKIKGPNEYANYLGLLLLNISQSLRNKIVISGLNQIPFVLDVVGIGAGLNNSQVFSILKQSAPDAKVLILEARETVSIFGELGDSFLVNSVESPATDGKPYGTSNFFSGTPIQVRDYNVDNKVYVSSKVFANTITSAFCYSQTPIVFSQQVVSVEERGADNSWPARYKISTNAGLVVYANHVIAGTGLGEPRTVVGDQITQNLIKESLLGAAVSSKFLFNSNVPGIETVDAYLKRFNSLVSQGIDPMEEGVTAVIGGKDGSNVAIEALSGITHKLGLHKNGAHIIWVGHCATKEDFIHQFMGNSKEPWSSNTRNSVRLNRYSGIIPLLESGKIETMPGRLEAIRQVAHSEDKEQQVAKSKVKYQITVDGKSVIVDRVVLAIGYDNKVEEIFKQVSSSGAVREFADTSDYTLNLLQHGSFPVARKYKGHDVWIVGAACEKWSDGNAVIEKRDLVLTEGGGSAGILGSRSAAVGHMVAQLVQSIDHKNKVCLIPLSPQPGSVFNKEFDWIQHTDINFKNSSSAVLQIENKIKMARFFNKFRIHSAVETILELQISMTNIIVKGIDYNSSLALIDKLLEDEALLRSLGTLLIQEYSVKLRLVSRKEGGTFRVENMEHRLESAKNAPEISRYRARL